MSLVTVKNKFQVVIPQPVRQQAGIAIGDILEAKVERGKVVFEPKSIVDRGIVQSLKEFRSGKAFGPFKTHQEFISSLHQESKNLRAKNSKRTEK